MTGNQHVEEPHRARRMAIVAVSAVLALAVTLGYLAWKWEVYSDDDGSIPDGIAAWLAFGFLVELASVFFAVVYLSARGFGYLLLTPKERGRIRAAGRKANLLTLGASGVVIVAGRIMIMNYMGWDCISDWCLAVAGAAMVIFACETWPPPDLDQQLEERRG